MKEINKKQRRDKNILNKLASSLSYNRNLDTMKLLVSYPEFKKILAEIRNHLHIPPNGFGEIGGESYRKWHKRFVQESDDIMESKSFISQEIGIKNKFRRGEITRRMANKRLGLHYEQVPLQYLRSRVKFIIDKLHVPAHFLRFIECYIIFSIIDAPQHNYEGGFYSPGKLLHEERYIPIKIYSRLTRDEIEELNHYISWVGKKLPKYQVIKNIDKKLEIERWYENKDRTTHMERYRITNEEIAKNLLHSRTQGGKVFDIQRGLKRLRKERFGRSEKKR